MYLFFTGKKRKRDPEFKGPIANRYTRINCNVGHFLLNIDERIQTPYWLFQFTV